MDIISNLPNDIISHIGSFLSAKEAAFARVLSKRWRNLFTIVRELHFHSRLRGFDDDLLDNRGMFLEFVAGVLALPITTRIKKFTLKWSSHDIKGDQYDHINRCLIHVLKLGVMDFKLYVYGNERGYSLPFEVFTSKTVVKLNLNLSSCFAIDFLLADAYLPSLKTLSLDSTRFYESGLCAFNRLLSAAPVLEELVIKGIDWERWKWSFSIFNPRLQRLAIRRTEWRFYFGDDPNAPICLDSRGLAHEFNSLVLDIPALTYLDYAVLRKLFSRRE